MISLQSIFYIGYKLILLKPSWRYYNIDVKTHNTATKFNMPNIVSVERLARFYEDDSNYFTILMIAYHINQAQKIEATNCYFIPLEYLHWDCLTLGALG